MGGKAEEVPKVSSVGALTTDTAIDVAKLQACSGILQADLGIPAEDEVPTYSRQRRKGGG